MNRAISELKTIHGPSSHYACHADGTRMSQSFKTEVELVRHLKERWGIDLQRYNYGTKEEIPNAVFSHTWTRIHGETP